MCNFPIFLLLLLFTSICFPKMNTRNTYELKKISVLVLGSSSVIVPSVEIFFRDKPKGQCGKRL